MTNEFYGMFNTNFERGREGELLGAEDKNGVVMFKGLIVQDERLRIYPFGQAPCVGNCKAFFSQPKLILEVSSSIDGVYRCGIRFF